MSDLPHDVLDASSTHAVERLALSDLREELSYTPLVERIQDFVEQSIRSRMLHN